MDRDDYEKFITDDLGSITIKDVEQDDNSCRIVCRTKTEHNQL